MSQQSRAPDREPQFRSLYERAYADVFRFVDRRVHPDHAEDVVAETFLVVWRRLEELPHRDDDARAWLFGIARHVLLNQRRGLERQRAVGVRLAGHALSRPSTVDDAHVVLLADLGRAWDRLSAVHQEVLALTAFEDLDAPRAAAVLGISPVAFRLRLTRARRALRLHLDHSPRDPHRPADRAAAPAACEGTTTS